MTKAEWRTLGTQRRAAAVDEQTHRDVCAAIRAWAPYAEARRVLTYLAFRTEVDLAALFDDEREWHVTRSWPDRLLTVHAYDPATLERHRFGYLQPPEDAPRVDLESIDLVLAPGLLFDATGTRLGYGMGHYDRLLPGLRDGVPRVGITFALTDEPLPAEPTDVPMTHVATTTGVERCCDGLGSV